MMMIVRTSWSEMKVSLWLSMNQECKYAVGKKIKWYPIIKDSRCVALNTFEGMSGPAKVTLCKPILGTATLKE